MAIHTPIYEQLIENTRAKLGIVLDQFLIPPPAFVNMHYIEVSARLVESQERRLIFNADITDP